MAVDVVPRNATGAALGIVGIASYIGAGLQDIISGTLIEKSKTVVGVIDGIEQYQYNFSQAGLFWIGASVLSFLLAILVWNAGRKK